LAVVAAWNLFRVSGAQNGSSLLAASADALSEVSRPGEGRPAVESALLRRLDRLMTFERAYRREGLTIGPLAAELGVPEYRLRQLINEGLGHRNFNAFLNRYRLDEAKAALADPGQREVPVLTIALDAGFQSIGPFNRAFKADTDVTPTEFRRAALADTASRLFKPLDKPAA
jgi:AraC-like DNA-binding protein